MSLLQILLHLVFFNGDLKPVFPLFQGVQPFAAMFCFRKITELFIEVVRETGGKHETKGKIEVGASNFLRLI